MTQATQGIALRLLSAFLITAMSAAVHQAAKTAPVGEIMFWRSAIALVPITGYMALRGAFPAALKTERPRLHVTRGTLGAASMAMSFLALAHLPVATVQALAFLAPVLVLPLASLLLKEPVGPVLSLAVATGFAGVIFLLWEALALPGQGAVIGVAAGLGYAGTMAFVRVHTKRMTVTEQPATIAFYFAVVSALVGLATLPFGWSGMGGGGAPWLILAGLLGGMAHIASNEAVLRAPVSLLAPFDFTALLWAMGFDLILFSQVPGPLGLVGIAAITAAAVAVALLPKAATPPAAALRR